MINHSGSLVVYSGWPDAVFDRIVLDAHHTPTFVSQRRRAKPEMVETSCHKKAAVLTDAMGMSTQ